MRINGHCHVKIKYSTIITTDEDRRLCTLL